MKTNIIKTISLIVLVACFGKVNAQSDLLAVNTTSAGYNSELYNSDNKIVVGNFKKIIATENNIPVVTVRCESPVTMKIRIFTLNGDLAREDAQLLDNGMNDLKVDMSELAQGVYMVQFFTSEGSAVRRFVKNN